jgi:hypothetical protein
MKRKLLYTFLIAPCILFNPCKTKAQQLWHNIQREVHYRPEGEDFVLVNGNRRFNRALYGGNTAFRTEAGDQPEFALYMPGMGGNLKFGLIVNDTSKWLINSQHITARYRPGSMIYEVADPLLNNGSLLITVLALYDKEGMIVKVEGKNVPSNVKLFAAFGGATGTKFSRDGDIGADPESSFYLKPEYCKDNRYNLTPQNSFTLYYGSKKPLSEEERYEVQHLPGQAQDTSSKNIPSKALVGVFPSNAQLKISDAASQSTPLAFYASSQSITPALTSQVPFADNVPLYFLIQNFAGLTAPAYASLETIFNNAESSREQLANRVKINTPDPYINTLGGALSVAADAIWEDPSYLHGAVAWRMRLNAWRGAYVADVLGWHDRARSHFSSYALSQLTEPLTGPVVADTALHLARQLEKLGTSLFSSGYISRNPGGDKRPHHYDMNLVFIDQLLSHFYWSGDKAYIKQMWPVLARHLAWEKRNFDVDGDGLYDAYAAIWASDALQYSGGGVTHSSAYNYRANKVAAELATLIGKNPEPYKREADKILNAINKKLWMPNNGWYAEYKDLLGLKQVHPSAAIWTIYHSLDSKTPNPFQAYQSLKYIDNTIPHIPIRAKGLADTTLYTISTTSWQPYTWSLNNVALGEVLHTALAYWQGGRSEEAYKLWKSSLVESMYLGASPGNLQQLSFYDAIRGELYRDFADPIGMAGRSLVEGLFGIEPDGLHNTLHITPGFPTDWNHASITTPDINYAYVRNNTTDKYMISALGGKQLKLHFAIKAKSDGVEKVTVNGRNVTWHFAADAIETPMLEFNIGAAAKYDIEITWKGSVFEKAIHPQSIAKGEQLEMMYNVASIQKVYDPQHALSNIRSDKKKLSARAQNHQGYKTFFVQLKQGQFVWWQPVSFKAVQPVEIIAANQEGDNMRVYLRNNTTSNIKGTLFLDNKNPYSVNVVIPALNNSPVINIASKDVVSGSNKFTFKSQSNKPISVEQSIINWNIKSEASNKYEKINLQKYFNDDVTNIFKNQYLSPRPAVPTLQLPTQGIGNWCYPLTTANIDDSGLRKRAANGNEIVISQGVPFATPSTPNTKNIAYTSLWDNYPDSVKIPLNGKASHAYFLMAGSTNPMQTRFTNGVITIHYKDGSSDKLELKNPENWWPIEEDYYVDGYAFTTDAPKPVRVYLKTGEDTRQFRKFYTIKGFSNMGVDGGAATVLDLALNKAKELKSVTLKTLANDVVIGLMSLTLIR